MLAGIFMVHLECTLIPKLTEYMNPWKRYVNDTISIIKETSITHVLTVLKNDFHKNIEFTYEMEENWKIAFLDVLIIRNNKTLKATVYRKKTYSSLFTVNWKSFASLTWKCSTLQSIITRAYRICSTQEYLEAELLLKIKHMFTQINGYPKGVSDKINEESKLSGNLNITINNKSNTNKDIANTTHMLVLPYKSKRGQRIIKSINEVLKKIYLKTMLHRTFIKVRI